MRRLLLAVQVVLISSCGTHFGETHYFQSVKVDPISKAETVTNFYRLKVSGIAAFSGARYVSGYYDERAVDLFFNEMKLGKTDETKSFSLFSDDLKDPGGDEKIKPLSPSDQTGAFVMVLSTNASAVTNTIGQFSENQIAAEAITNLVNRESIRERQSDSQADAVKVSQAKNTAIQLDKLFELIEKDKSSLTESDANKALLRILNTIARAQGKGQSIESFEDAEVVFRGGVK
jgi:hypothetical protein